MPHSILLERVHQLVRVHVLFNLRQHIGSGFVQKRKPEGESTLSKCRQVEKIAYLLPSVLDIPVPKRLEGMHRLDQRELQPRISAEPSKWNWFSINSTGALA